MKSILHSMAMVTLIMIMVTSCSQAPNTLTAEDRAAITKAHKAATGPVETNPGHVDWKAFTQAHYSQDAVLLPPNSPEIVGQAAIIAFMSSYPPLNKFQVKDEKMEGTPEVAYIKVTYNVGMNINDSTKVNETGRDIELWKKYNDGTWRCFLDIWNTDMAAAGAK